jgi:hypothetical protein
LDQNLWPRKFGPLKSEFHQNIFLAKKANGGTFGGKKKEGKLHLLEPSKEFFG